MKKKSKNKIGLFINLIIFTAGLLLITFNNNGLLKYFSLKNKLLSVNKEVAAADKKIKNLKSEIDSLKTSLAKIEKTAREKYYMKKKNEIVIQIEEYTP